MIKNLIKILEQDLSKLSNETKQTKLDYKEKFVKAV